MAEPTKRNYGTVYDALKAISDEENVDFGIDSYTKEQFRDKYFTGPGNIENLYNNLSQVSDETQLDFGLGTRDEWLESFGFRKSGNGYQYLDGSPVGRAKPKQQTAAATQPTAQPKPQPKYTIPDEPQIYRPEEPEKPAWQQMLMGQEPQQEETWAQKGVREVHENLAEEESRRAQPLVDTGIESMNNGVIKTVGQWEDELQAGVNELSSKWVRPQVDAAMQEAKDAWSKTMDAYRYAPAQAQLTMANQNLDPDRIITRISAALEDAYNTPEMQRDIAEKANAAGIPVEDYISQVVKPTLQGEMQQYFYQRELQEYLPKNTIEYIAQGLNNSIAGMLNTAVTDSKSMRQLRNEAAAMTEEGDNADYTPGIGAKLGQLAVSFTADSPFFGLYGQVSGSVVKKVAEREIKKMMAKGLTEGAARNIVGTALENSLGKRMKNYLMSHIISSGTTLAGYNMTSEAARQVNASEFKPGQILKSGAEGFATGAALGATGAVTEALTQPLAGIQKIGAKALGFGAEAETMYATEELAKLAQGEDAFTNPFEGTVESMMKLGVMKVSSPEGLTKTTEAILHPIRSSKRQQTGVNFTKEEQELLRQSVEGSNFIRALSDMQAEVSRFDINQRTESNPELKAARERLARNYNEVMSNTEFPATLKEKLAAVSGGIYRRGLETGADIVHNADGSVVVMTRDKDGNCIQRIPFDSFTEAEEWRDQYTDHFRLNDVANTWNDMSVESRTAALKRVADEHGTDAEGAANMITAALRGMMGTDFTDGELLSVVDAVTETAYPSDEPHTAHNYAEGRKMAPEERRAAVRDVERAESKLTYWGQEYADEVMGAVDNPDAKVAELAARDDTTGDQVQAAVDYYNKRAKADGALDEALAKVDEQVTEANADVVRNTHQESGKVVEVDLWGNKYYITAGKIQIDANGQIDPYNSDKTIVARNVDTGEMRMLSPDRPITVTSLSNPKDIVAANESMEGMRGQLLEEVSNSVTYAEGTPMEPVSGDIYTGSDGKRYVVLDTFDQESGTVSHNKVEVKPDGSFDFEKTLPFDLDEYRRAKSDEIEAAAEAEAGIAPVVEEAPSVVGGEEQAVVEEAPSVVERETPAAPVAEEKPAAPAIPTDEQGRPQYERASVEDTKADLVGKYGDEITGQMVDQMVAASAKAVDDLEKQDMTGVTDMAELAQHYDDLIAARKKKEYWEQVRESLKAPEKPAEPVAEEKPATPVEEEKPVEPTPEEKPAAVDEKPAAPVAEEKPAAPVDEAPAAPVEDSKKKAAEERKKKLERAYKTSRHRKLLTSVLDDAEQEELLAAHEKVERLRAEMAADAKSFTSYLNKKYAGEDMSNVDVRNRYNAEMDEHSRRWEEANGLLKAIDAESELVSRLSDKHMEDLFGAEATERTRIIGDSHGTERYKKAKEAYKGTEAEALFDDDTPIDVYEFVSQNMPKNISWEDIEVGGRVKRGLASELGWKGTKRGIGHGKSTNAFNAYLAKKGEGISLQDAVHQLFTAADGKYSDADIRNAVLDMFLNASKLSDISDYWINERISAAESIISSAKEQELADYENYLATTGLRFSNKRRLNTPDAINRVYLARRREIDRDLMDARWRLVRERARLQAMKDAAPEEGTMFPEVEADLSDANKERILKPLQDDIAYYERLAATNERERLKALRDARDAEKRQTEISFADRLEQQKAATNTNPSIAQKESGNYRKGRLSFGGYEFVIENPKGSERSGVDAEGNEWSQEMNNTYGYIRGRKGRDGDAIDMFINDNADLDNWNGTVYVVDQVRPDGTFDEHKVMYGFGSEEEARQAYLSNYEDGWKGLGNITGVDKATFDKWLESSRKKVKPFAEHATVLHALGKHPWGADEEARRAPLRKRLDRWTDNGAIKVNIVESVDEVSNAEALARIEAGEDVRGWFDTKTKEAYIYMPNIKDARQLDRAFLHEVVSHKGLRSLLGDQAYNQLCDAVYDSMSYEDRQEYLNYANVKKMGGLAAQRAAADEYMAHLSEDSSLSKSTWQKIVKWVKDKFREKFGGEELLVTDGDIEKLLRASYKNMRRENRERAIKEISKETEGQMDGQATRMSTSSIIEGGGFKAGITDDDGNISPMTDKEGNMVIEMGGKTFSAKMPVTLRDMKEDRNSTLNIMLKFAVEDAKTITKERADVIRQKYADIINMYLKAGAAENGGPEAGTNGKWLWLGETVFRTIATNGDKQYSYSADITRVCKKNEAVIRAISALQQAQGYGATPSQVMDIYEATRIEGYQVPCPVCYVFSRYLSNGRYASAAIKGMRKYGKHLPGGSKPWTLDEWVAELHRQEKNKIKKSLSDVVSMDISGLLKAIDRRGMKLLDARTSKEEKEKLRKEIEQLDAQYRAALDVTTQQSMTNWIKTFAIQSVNKKWQMRPDAKLPEDMKDFEDNALDIRRVAETIRKYPAIQRLRKSGGASAGKEITFESNNELGEIVSGVGTSEPSESINWFKAAAEATTDAEREQYMAKARKRFADAVLYAKRQSLRGGQRMWSWSDNIEALSPDVAVNLMQMEMLGGALQAYSKQLEGVALAASMGGYVNGSLMAKDSGWREVTEDMIERRGDKIVLREDIGETIMEPTLQGWRRRERVLAKAGSPIYEENGKRYVLIFDDIIGIDPYGRVDDKGNHLMGLFDLNNQYDRAGNIIVGMNDRHVRASMADDRIYFIIPWHSSGQSVHILKSMLGFLGTDLRNFNPVDYTNMQEEKNYGVKDKKGKYPKVPSRLVDIWEKYRNENDWTSGIGAIASGDGKGGLSRQQWEYRRLRDAIFDGTIDSDPKSLKKVKADAFLSQVYEKVKTHGGSMTSADKEFIYPYEYWDEKSTYDNADVNGARYLEYCRRLGFRPKFTGKWDAGGKWTNEGNFAEDHGYWKLLIDRRMYDRNGRFQDLTPTNSEGFTPDLVDPVVTGSRYVRTQVADPEGTRRIVGRVLKLQDERAELTGNGVPQANYDMSMQEAVSRYNKARSKIKVTDEDYQHKTYEDPENGGTTMFSVVTDKSEVDRLEKEPKATGFRNVVINENGGLGSPMADKLKGRGSSAKTSGFEFGKWERSDENPDLADDNGKITLVKPDGLGDVQKVDYNPYIHIRPTLLNKQFKNAWERDNLIYIEVEYPASEESGGYKAEKAKKSVGRHPWGGGELILSRWDKPFRQVPWEEVADTWEKEFKKSGVHFDIVPPKLLPILAERGVKILPPHKGMGQECFNAYQEFQAGRPAQEGAVRFSIGKNGRQLQLFGEDEMTGGMVPREGNLFEQKKDEGRQVDMFEQAARISDEVEKDEAAATAATVVKESPAKIDDFGKKIGLARKDVAVSGINRGKRSAVPSWRKKYQMLNVTEEMLNSKDNIVGEQVEFDPSKPFIAYTIKETPWFRRMVPVKDKDGKIMMFRSQEELESVLPVFEAASQGFKVKENEGRFEIVKRASTGKDVMYGVFDTKEDAEAYLNSPEGATTLLNHKARNYEFPPLENLTRIGMKDWRQGRDITGQDMLEEFGFRGGEFGNWVSDAERQQFLNTAYDSLKDLAELLGISPRALSLGGALSIAFGARGHSKYAAHYEPGRAVINMTKMKGAGSLAHEWAHALDNYFGMMMAGLEREHGGKNERYATEEYYSPRVRREVMEAFRDVVNTMKRKIVTRAKDTTEAQAQVDDLRKKLDYAIKRERESLMRGVRKYEYNRSTKQRESKEYKPTEEDMKEFDRLIAELEKDPQWNWDPTKQGWRLTSDAGKALYDLIKVYEPNTKGTYGPAHNVAYYLDKLKKATDRLNEAKAGESETVAVDTDFTKGSRRADAGRAGSYYAKTIEMFARAFETYLADKMAKAGKSSDYLTYRKGDIFKTLFGFSVYPEGEELKAVSKAMDKLFETIDEKVDDDGNTILFSVKDDAERRTPIFQSNAARAVEGIRQEKATPEQWQKMIENAGGMKAAEDKWTGLSDWLKGQDKKSLTKEEVMDYIRKNQVRVEEVNYNEHIDLDNNSNMRQLREEFDDSVEKFKQEKEAVDAEMVAFNDEMYGKYGEGWSGKLSAADKERGEKLQTRYNRLTDDPKELAFNEMVERYGDDFGMAFEVNWGNGKLEPQMDMYGDDISDAAKYFLQFEEQPINSTRLSYTTKGLENKKEIALTVPTVESWNESDEIHFGDAGGGRAVAWVRFGDTEIPRKDPEARKRFDDAEKAWDDFGGRMYDKYGASYSLYLNEAEKAENSRLQKEYEEAMANYKEANSPQRVLVIDEIQSKRHQEGRERGYRTADSPVERRHRATEAMNDYRQKMQEKYGDYFVSDDMSPEEKAEYDRLYQEMKDAMAADNDKNKSYDIPEAPFEKNWHELAMKRMLRYAAENGYDKIAWTKGEQQAERYNLAKTIPYITRQDTKSASKKGIRVFAMDINGEPQKIFVNNNGVIATTTMFISDADGKPLSDFVGKELAVRMMAMNDGETIDTSKEKVGGEGMKGFYDKMLPNFMNKYGKKWGVKVEEVELPKVEKAGRSMWAVDVTPEMKESVTQEPQLMFSIGGERGRNERRRPRTYGVPYQGGKSRIAGGIIDALPSGRRFVDLFSGGGAVTHAAMLSDKYGRFRMNDINPVGQELFLQGARGEWRDYDRKSMTDEEFEQIKGTPEALPWSFNGLGRNLAKDRDSRNKAAEQIRRVQSLESLKEYADLVEASGDDYRNVKLRPGDVVYADIPYEDTDQLAYRQGRFNKQEFIDWAQAQDVPVYVSEYSMPEGWTEIASFGVPGMRGGRRTEKLFVQDKFAGDGDKEGGDIRFMLRGEVGTVKDIAAQRQLNTAREMEKGGKDSKAIWLATGWERGADGQWRNEIPDARPKRIDPKKVKTLGDLIDAPEMFESYPELRDYKVTMKKMKAAGSFNAEEKEIKLDTEYNTVPDISPEDEERIHAMTMDFIRNGNWKTSRDVTNYKKKLLAGYGVKLDGVGLSTILHEMQHAIQRIEGFSRGGNADIMAKEFLVERAKVDPELATFAEEFAQYSTANDMMRYGRENFAKLLRRENANVTEENKSKIADLAEALEVMSDSDFSDFVDMAKRLASRAKKEGLARYHRIAGEVEARNVEARNKMTDDERLQTPPSETEDTGRDEQILRFSTGERNGEKQGYSVEEIKERVGDRLTINNYTKVRSINPLLGFLWSGKYERDVDFRSVFKTPDLGNYYIATKTEFKTLDDGPKDDSFETKWAYEEQQKAKWEKMKASGKYEFEKSPKSSSEYLIDHETGDIYRYSDHWGRVASCEWDIDKPYFYGDKGMTQIAKSNIKDFKPNEMARGLYYTHNPEYDAPYLDALTKTINNYRTLLGSDVEMTDAVRRTLQNRLSGYEKLLERFESNGYTPNQYEVRFMTGGGGRSGEDAQALYETALANWKRRNGLPDDAVEPTPEERPVHHPGEDVIEYARALSNYNRNVAMWQTAPRLEDYENRRQEKQVIENAIAEARRYPESQGARMNVMEAELVRLRHAVSRQRTYDRATVKAVTDFAQEFMRQGFGDNMTRGEMERVLSAVKNATGARDIKKHVDKVLDILVDSHLRNLDNSIWKMSSIRELKQNAVGVEVQGRLELKGQRMIQAFREAIGTKMSADDLRARLGEIGDKMSSDREDADMWEQEYEGVSIALQYVDNINGSRQEWENLRQQYKDAIRDYRASGRSYEAQQQLLESINESMRENKIERIGLYQDIIQRLGGNIEESREGAKAFVEREKERVARIHTLANTDLAGKPMGAMRQSTKMSRLANSTGARFFLSPLATFEQMLRQFGSRNARGEGNLYNHFMRTWIDSIDREFTNTTAAKEELDAKAREVFGGKVKRWSDLYELVRRLPMAEVSVVDQGEPKTYTLTQGNLLYIYMADKMTDGKMKLREMGITEENVEEIKAMLDPRLIALGDWLQEDYLVRKRVEYNKVHERMFGAPMAAIENYFPIKVLKDARYIEEDVGLPETDLLPTTVTGSIIKRRRNSLPLDILNTDALSLAIEHVEDMEHWAATAEWNKDVNTLLSYTTFRNKVKNMNTIYGSGDQLWNTFKAAAQMAAGEYRPRVKPGSVDKTISNIAKGVTAAKISFRVYTAFKQTLSAPAFLHDVNLGDFVKYGANPYGSWKWAMENMPVFKKRWMSRQAGDTRLMDDPTDWKLWKDNIVQLASRMGMSPNALVDGVTCAVGARAIYESRLKKYMKMGVSEATAKRRALQDAEIGYNLTQQSSEGAFVSAIQKDRTLAANALSVFRNSSMAYTRQWVDAARNLKHRFEPGYKEDSIKFMAQQLQNDLGLDAGQARKAAEQEYARAGRHEVAKLLNFMFGVTFAWNLGASLPYLLIGDDDETKKQMLEDAAFKALFAGPTEGLASGNIYSDLVGLATNEQVRKAYSTEGAWGSVMQGLDNMGDYDINPLPLMADISRLISKMKYDGYAAAQEVFNICMQSGVGVNPQTFTDMWNACMDYAAPAWDGTSYTFDAKNMAHAKEIALFFMRIANAPTSSWRNKYIDELGMTGADADKLPYDELAKRYAHYKHWKDVPVMGFFRSKDERAEKMGKIRKQFDKAVEERMARLEGDELQDNLERSMDGDERRMIAKLIHQRIMGSGEDAKKPKADWQRQYQKWMTYEDIRDAEMLSRIKTEAKSAGDKTTVDYITKTNSKITEIKKNLIKGEQSGEEMMEQIRQIRRKALQQVRKDYNINEE